MIISALSTITTLFLWITGTVDKVPCPPAEILFLGAESALVPPTFFILYTRRNPYFPENISLTNCNETTNFDPNLKTVIIADGHTGSPNNEHIITLKTAYLHYENCNVIIMDWSIASAERYIPNAIRNSLIIGKYIAERLEFWKANCGKLNFTNFHIIGFSLGGHMVGFIGKYMKTGKIGRITGLDVAGICFYHSPPKYRLHYTDAMFVDVITTSDTAKDIGHVNFYPDGGRIGRGCADLIFDSDFETVLPCSHLRAVYLFASTLYSQCLPVGYICADKNTFNRGECSDCGEDGRQCAAMGIHADRYADKITDETAKMYLSTTFTDNYCLYQYRVEVTLTANANSTLEMGKLVLIINNGLVTAVLNKNVYFQYVTDDYRSGGVYTYLMTTTHNVDYITQLEFLWYSTTPRSDNRLYIQCVKIVPMNNLEVDRSGITTYGTTNGEAIPPHYIIPLMLGSSC